MSCCWIKGTGWTIGSGVATSDSSAQSGTSYLESASFTALDTSTTYKLSFRRVQTNTGSLRFLAMGSGDTVVIDYNTTTTGTDEVVYFKPNGANTSIWITSLDGNFSGSVDNISLKEVNGNVGTMTNQDSADLVYSSVLPDQSFLATGVNSAYNFIDLDGGDQYIDCGDIDTSGNFTFSCWFNADSVAGHNIIFSMSDKSISDGMTCGFLSGKGGKIYATANNGNTSSTKITSVLSTGQWYHLVVTKSSGQTETIYINGISDTNSADTHWGLVDETIIGARNAGSNYLFNGKISQVSVFNKILSATEVSAIYNLGRHGNILDSYSDNLKGYWAMSALDASTGLSDSISTIYDRSGNSNHGTPQNADAGDLTSSPNAEPNGYAKQDSNRTTTTP